MPLCTRCIENGRSAVGCSLCRLNLKVIELFNVSAARAARLFFLTYPLKSLFSGVAVAIVAV